MVFPSRAAWRHLHKQSEKLDSVGRIDGVQNTVKCSRINKQERDIFLLISFNSPNLRCGQRLLQKVRFRIWQFPLAPSTYLSIRQTLALSGTKRGEGTPGTFLCPIQTFLHWTVIPYFPRNGTDTIISYVYLPTNDSPITNILKQRQLNFPFAA